MPASDRLPKVVIALAFTSFFTDIGTEMIAPLLPAYLASLGATPLFLGLIEGVADATSSVLKLASGIFADRTTKRMPLVLFGYGLASFVRPLVAFATAPWHVLAVRVTDRVGKGLRTAPRDLLLANSVTSENAGRAFGLHQAMDHAGAIVGPLVATALLVAGVSLKYVFLCAFVPGTLAMIAAATVREAPAVRKDKVTQQEKKPLNRNFFGYLFVLAFFCLANSSDAFLLLRASEIGIPRQTLPLVWAALHVSKSSLSYVGGRLADRYPRVRLMVIGWLVFAVTYFGFAFASRPLHVWLLFLLYGAYYGLAEPSEKALVRDLVPAESRGRAFGAFHFVIGVVTIPAGLLMGSVWTLQSPKVALELAAALVVFATCLLVYWSRTTFPRTPPSALSQMP